ncbi:putative phosphoserine phosphatase [Helianthus anomalus]
MNGSLGGTLMVNVFTFFIIQLAPCCSHCSSSSFKPTQYGFGPTCCSLVPNLTFRSCRVAATDVVRFDVDTIVCVDEDIAGKVVAEWTAREVGGSAAFQEALAARLDLFKPSSSTVLRSDPQGFLLA